MTLRDFNAVQKSLVNQRRNFTITEKGERRTIYFAGKPQVKYMGRSNLSAYFRDTQKLNLIRTVHAQVNKYIKAQNFLIEEIEPTYKAIKLKRELYRSYPDEYYFYLVDIKHAYWRFAYLLGYINHSTYTKYKDDPDYKLARLIALSTLSSKKKRKYYINGKFINEILSYDMCSWIIYKNIRHSTYNICGELNKILGDKCLSYRVDGVMVVGDVVPIVKEFMKINKLSCKIVECQKVNHSQYVITETGEVKNL